MDTQARTIEEWLRDTKQGDIALPRFQRHMVWDYKKSIKLLEAILNENPIGVFLLLEIDSIKPPFPARFLETNSHPSPDRTKFHLLDGQQRITSLFKILNNEDNNNTFYMKFRHKEESIEFDSIERAARNSKKNKKIIGVPSKEFDNHWIPMHILNPTTDENLISNWLEEISLSSAEKGNVKKLCTKNKQKIAETIIPYFHLPLSTKPENAINIYINLNTQSVKLTAFYTTVARMEQDVEESLLEIIESLEEKVPPLSGMESSDPGNLFLKIGCLKQKKAPTDGQYKRLDLQSLYETRDEIINGISWAVEEINKLGIAKGKQLPTSIPLRVLPAIHESFKKKGRAQKARAIEIKNRYLWHAFLTERYEKSVNTRLKEDSDDLKELLENKDSVDKHFEKWEEYLPNDNKIREAGWPGNAGRLSRTILVACTLLGAKDIWTDEKLNYSNEADWNLDHIFLREK